MTMAWLNLSYGEAVALLCAVIWASNSLVLKTLTHKIPAALITAIRCGFSGLMFWGLMIWGPPLSTLALVPLREWVLLIGSVTIGIVIGDLFYLHAMKEIGVSRAMALVGTFPITTLIFQQLLLDYPVTRTFVLASCLAAAGVICLSGQAPQDNGDGEKPVRLKRGAFLALMAALFWGLSTVMLKPAIANLTSVQANSVRMPLVALALTGIWRLNRRSDDLKEMNLRLFGLVALTGILGMGIGSYLYLESVEHIGPAKTATISAATPVITLILAIIFLKEKITLRLLLGVALCVSGVLLVL